MQVRLSTLILVVLLVASCIAALETTGIAVAGILLLLLGGIRTVHAGRGVIGCLLVLLAGLTTLAVFGVCVIPREVVWRAQCVNNLKQIALALHIYHDQYGCFPPPVVRGADGTPMHSWRVLILPFLGDSDSRELYKQYDFSQPWDGPNNRSLAQLMPHCYACPSVVEKTKERYTTQYVAVTGPGTIWPPEGESRIGDVTDGTPNTLLVVEWGESDIHWMEPRDLVLPNPARADDLGYHVPSGHPYETGYFIIQKHIAGNVATVDGSVGYAPWPLSAEGLAALAQRSDDRPGRDSPGLGILDHLPESFFDTAGVRYANWRHIVAVILLVPAFSVLLWRALFGPIETAPREESTSA